MHNYGFINVRIHSFKKLQTKKDLAKKKSVIQMLSDLLKKTIG